MNIVIPLDLLNFVIVRIPAISVAVVNGTGPNFPRLYDVIVEPSQTTGYLPSSLIVVYAFVTVRNGHFSFRVANIGHDDIWIIPRTRVGILLKGDIGTSDNGKIEFMRTEFTEEIYVNEDVYCSETSIKSQDFNDFEMFIVIGHLSVPNEMKHQIRTLFYNYTDVFSKNGDDVGYTDTIKHRIRTMNDDPVVQPYRRIPPTQYEEVKNHIKKLIENKIIRENTSPYTSPIVLVRKKDNSLRMCVDYRKLNCKTYKDAYPLPRVEESFDALSGSKYFSTMDLTGGYNQVAMNDDDIPKTAFTIHQWDCTNIPECHLD